MALFQDSVRNKYLQNLDRQAVNAAYVKFDKFFHNSAIQENIRNSKEEQYQGEFLIDLFVNILGYTKNPKPHYNLTTEYKNVKDSKKADGAIIINDAVKAVIELKGTDTTDLSKIENQAFGYKNNQSECVYVIISNFEKLRFYIDNAIEYIEFNLFTLTEAEFELLYLCLAYDNIRQGVPKQIKDESLSQEGVITKKLYNDYSLFKRELHQNLVALNPDHEPLELFKKSQKLLDRFLFLFFAEDRLLLPPNSVRLVLNDWRDLQDRDVDVPLYDRFKKYFEYLNTGYKGKRYDVYAYNGGLFKPDAILDAVKIDSELLYRHTFKLSEYDFASEVDVNILGHIFENSLNELDEIKAQLAGLEIDKTKTKRKKDGVFYTPKYITKYIVDNTVGKLCLEQKAELQINEDDYINDKRKTKPIRQALNDKLTAYRKWLLQLTICDPACGSGAFLNQALDFLIKEHQYLDELHAKLFGDTMILSDVEKSILENNLFGVDLNEESVEIAKLSLWLRTAQPNRKLNDLNNNIKCGNSLIDDPAVAGEKAFNWQKEFPQIFEKGGFDVVIGNPPYLRVQGLRENFERESHYYENVFLSATGRFDIYVLFMERAFKLIKQGGALSFILPHKFTNSEFGVGIRKFIYENKALQSIIHFGSEMVFADASTYTCIITLSHNNDTFKFSQVSPNEISRSVGFENIPILQLSNPDRWKLQSNQSHNLIEKLKHQPLTVKDVFKGIFQGIVTGDNKAFYLYDCNDDGGYIEGYNEVIGKRVKIEKTLCREILTGKTINRYNISNKKVFLIYTYELKNLKTQLIPEDKLKVFFPQCYQFLLGIKDRLTIRGSKSMKYPCWYSLWNFRNINNQAVTKILTPDVCFGGSMCLDAGTFFYNDTSYAFILKCGDMELYRVYLSILNSSITWFFLQNTGTELRGGYFRFKTKYLEPFPLPDICDDKFSTLKTELASLADLMLSLNKDLQETSQRFQRTLQRKFELAELPGKLQDWYLLAYADFIKELGKKKIKLSLAQEAEWEEYFVQESQKARELKATIDATDKAIDQMVYALYGLTEEEIKIVEGKA